MRIRVSALAMAAAFQVPLVAEGQGVASHALPAWLAGCWRMESPARVVDEMWMSPRGGTMLGMGRTVRRANASPSGTGEIASTFEFVRILSRSDTLIYAANPSGQTPAEFIATTRTENELVFENPTHDFPQRVIYRRIGKDSLYARVDGKIDGRERAQVFPYARVRCEGPAR